MTHLHGHAKDWGKTVCRRKTAWAFPAKKINEVGPEVQRKVEAADKGYIPTISMNQPYLSHLKNQHQLSAEISLFKNKRKKKEIKACRDKYSC